MNSSSIKIATIALLVGGALGFCISHFNSGMSHELNAAESSASNSSNDPLYWVAPMDPNYKRDKPGKSPMGMDLIPVYAEDLAGEADKPGTVKIDPSVENNLGVKTAQVSLEKLSPRIETVGYIAFDESQLWQTNVRVAGWVEKLHINAVGEKVQKGNVLFTLYSPELVKAQEELLNAYRTGRSGLVKGATERLVTLGVDRSQIDAIKKRGKASQTIEIKAPEDGIIASLNVREGGYLSPAQAVISAGPLENVWVDAEVFERQAHWMKADSDATMTLDAIPGKSWQGNVDYVYPILDPKTRTLRVRLKFPNPNGELKPNMFANITLQPVSETAVLTIPRASVIRSGGMTRVVLAEGDGKYRSTRIEVGREADDRTEVLEGLSQGDRIVTSAHFMLDSESSQTADLSRISAPQEPTAVTAWAKGEITDVMKDHRMLTINHQPVPEWDWPGMVMNFTFADGVELGDLQKGQMIEFEMKKTESGQYEIIDDKADGSVVASDMWLTGDVSMLMADFGMITLNHMPVAEWNWDAGEMNFTVGDEVNLSGFTEGQKVRFLIEKQGSDYLLKQLEAAED
ncbi:Belongs to the membrane fusion protein (MFP) (TC 8.A.1) family [Vibrio sp. B1FLJ16]|uniref:efflux RND transporter periplasmic adaptor subunit n=1 Tax=Vibrio sp. B1FLJ16 TaxID=2751178 RepID=UPI0015F4CB20|nr:efflux RND transporter periplasmic adaptor subunit [Vibrio sp. B1FLJ16]CAD7821966.1 Belongs to the membrane fusion protein (MFP) (TC 8.A.1) family [Vibrio sp. B1FLJ16]CAE6947702.1 Belongs to the membrane fusion protein (MFP) (TC 8.A.1) family [Vibrio sp. B1FLJ16]